MLGMEGTLTDQQYHRLLRDVRCAYGEHALLFRYAARALVRQGQAALLVHIHEIWDTFCATASASGNDAFLALVGLV